MNGARKFARYLQNNERANCAIIANVKKNGVPSHGNIKRTLEALDNMGHRTGEVEYEGDGAGIQTDIPRKVWEKILTREGIRTTVPYNEFFTVGHFFIRAKEEELGKIVNRIREIVEDGGLNVVYHRRGDVRSSALGAIGRKAEPVFYQAACIPKEFKRLEQSKEFAIQLRIEREIPEAHVVSFSRNSVIYKVRGDVRTLREYYPELMNPDYTSAISLAHGRFSTNTDSIAERAQMFSTLGHNGEINTISRLRHEARMLGVQLVANGSDSQDLDRIVESLMFEFDFTLMEALNILFPPVWSEIEKLQPDLREMYLFYRRAFGSLAQGPAALICRQGDEVAFSVDAMGLRPLWFGETEKEYFASSEKGVVPIETMVCDPTPLAPGEKKGFLLHRQSFDRETERLNKGYVQVFSHEALQTRTLEMFKARFKKATAKQSLTEAKEIEFSFSNIVNESVPSLRRDHVLAAFGWSKDDSDDLLKLGEEGKETIGSMGHDCQLAALGDGIRNLTEFFKETVAVVTNPSVDGIREEEHFSTKVFLGNKPELHIDDASGNRQLSIDIPVIFKERSTAEENAVIKHASRKFGTIVIDELSKRENRNLPRAEFLKISYSPEKHLKDSLANLKSEVVNAVRLGVEIVVLSDFGAFERGEHVIDPALAVAAAYNSLEEAKSVLSSGAQSAKSREVSLKRRASIVIESGAIRNVHDMMILLGLGASAVVPYFVFDEFLSAKRETEEKSKVLSNGVKAIVSGVEKVMSTMGIHEVEGYGKIFASIGFSIDLQEIFRTHAYLGSEAGGLTLDDLNEEAELRYDTAHGKSKVSLKRQQHFNGKIWKTVNEVAKGDLPYETYREKLDQLEGEFPVGLRHILNFKKADSSVSPESVEIKVGEHSTPLYISAMSFGSQGEISFRSYAEGAYRLNTVSINGEGGEIDDLIGKYYYNRGQQIASARFGVNAKMLNSARFLEIKIGQGAKPGEGGMLPALKVTSKIASTRHTPEKIDLISPSNNHDIYSIEDLAQLIEELKTINPDAKISVKIPSIPLIGPIATGIAKAGADIITISGYEGGTGAARKHSLKYVGFPAEIGVREAHLALCMSGLRSKVEIWSDGGMRSGKDAVKMLLLGADRVGFGTYAMLAIGCTQCRKCSTGTCHVGITSHFKDESEANMFGQKIFEPRNFDEAVQGIVTLFNAFNQEVKTIVAGLGFASVREIVGRSSLLQQSKMQEKIDLSFLTDEVKFEKPVKGHRKRSQIRRPLTFLTRMITASVLEAAAKDGSEEVIYSDEEVFNSDRAIGTHLSGELTRLRSRGSFQSAKSFGQGTLKLASLEFKRGVIPGNGLGAFNTDGVEIRIEGGAQDGVAKSASGGRVVVLKGKNHDGELVDGSVGKYFAYGAQGGLFIVQGNADARAGIRLSGADVVIGAEVREPLRDELGSIASRANMKGFAFEYMTSGRAVVLGDPGPWMCSGMTGGVIYFRIDESVGLTTDALSRRLAKNSSVKIFSVDETDEENLRYLIGEYVSELEKANQFENADRVASLIDNYKSNFVKGIPFRQAAQKVVSLPSADEVVVK
ncbi:MAG: glutamate synthase-related protein [Bacteroidetes bacterium]|nr:glutamate synthase-related protein [Bacteroidota bacterium]